MQVVKLISLLREDQTFKEWVKDNSEAKLVHVFLMIEPGQETRFDIGFFDYKQGLMTSFVVDKDVKTVEINTSKDVFAKDPQKIQPLEEERVRILFDDALKTAIDLQKEKYKTHIPTKEVVILQNLEVGQVWNITFITKAFETLNIKVDAETGKVLEDKLHKIFSM